MAALAAFCLFVAITLSGLWVGSSRPWLPSESPHRTVGSPSRPSRMALVESLRGMGIRSNPKRLLAIAAVGLLVIVILVNRLVGSLPVSLVIGGAVVAFVKAKLHEYEEKRRQTLTVQFKDALTAVTFSLRAGASLQTAIEQALRDLKGLYPTEKREPIVVEFAMLVQQIHLGVPVETALAEWDKSMGIESISDFVAGTLAVKARGGNLAEVMTVMSETINWKIVAQAQIRAITAEKRSEANMLTAAPSVVLIALTLMSPHYIAPLFQTDGGQVILLIGVICNVLAFFATRKVLETQL